MNNFHFPKIIATVGPSLAKETILSKIINFVDIFRINLSQGFDDMKKKYIDTILKLDNSKTIMLETKWSELRVKNTTTVSWKKNDEIIIDYSEYEEESTEALFIDYTNITSIPVGTEISFEDSKLILKVTEILAEKVVSTVISWGSVQLQSQIFFKDFEPLMNFLTPRDKKDIIRGIQSGVHIIVASGVKSHLDIIELENFLKEQNAENMKIIAKVDKIEEIKNIEDIIIHSDGIIITQEQNETLKSKKISAEKLCKKHAKPMILSIEYIDQNSWKKVQKSWREKEYLDIGIDGFMLGSETSIGEDPLSSITGLYEDIIKKPELGSDSIKHIKVNEEQEKHIVEYILQETQRVTQELNIKAIICFTNSGYTPSRLSSFNPTIPIISFTKSDATYRYINMLRGVRGYKISNAFDYENLKKIGKEMIRIIFKGNISLDDKIIILQTNEMNTDDSYESNTISGLEIYKFKDI